MARKFDPQMNKYEIKEVLDFLQSKKIPLRISIPLCLRLAGFGVSEMAARCGVSRGHFHQMISGVRPINSVAKEELKELGIEI